ncbi:hypothetical protein DFH09DRAFT_1450273 [Mycena vulgaris]|nr:hypothetical protein DFH09DRAFT_1450273 [Mycena vulgaris]
MFRSRIEQTAREPEIANEFRPKRVDWVPKAQVWRGCGGALLVEGRGDDPQRTSDTIDAKYAYDSVLEIYYATPTLLIIMNVFPRDLAKPGVLHVMICAVRRFILVVAVSPGGRRDSVRLALERQQGVLEPRRPSWQMSNRAQRRAARLRAAPCTLGQWGQCGERVGQDIARVVGERGRRRRIILDDCVEELGRREREPGVRFWLS